MNAVNLKAAATAFADASFSHAEGNGVSGTKDTPNIGMYVRAHHYPMRCMHRRRYVDS